eukprot:m.1199887 g.1199887  ORF g.1199887 m.1199887 type:complete len:185 (+) comp24572_c0_seq10:4337-4891(+)
MTRCTFHVGSSSFKMRLYASTIGNPPAAAATVQIPRSTLRKQVPFSAAVATSSAPFFFSALASFFLSLDESSKDGISVGSSRQCRQSGLVPLSRSSSDGSQALFTIAKSNRGHCSFHTKSSAQPVSRHQDWGGSPDSHCTSQNELQQSDACSNPKNEPNKKSKNSMFLCSCLLPSTIDYDVHTL